MSFNLYHGGPASGWTGDGAGLERRLDMVTRALRALDPDVVALQESSWGWWRGNVAARLGRALGLHHVYAPATARVVPLVGPLVVRAIGFSEGPALLSRFPVLGWEAHPLPRCLRRLDARVALRVELGTPWGPVEVVSTHATRGANGCQLEALADLVVARPSDRLLLVMGDLNVSEEAPALRALRDRAGLVDAFRAANPEAPGLTVWQRVDAPAPTVFRRVDYILVRPGPGGQGRVVGSRVVLDRPERGEDGATLWPSDHYGVLADLAMSASPAGGGGG